jgi:hypothetical protein
VRAGGRRVRLDDVLGPGEAEVVRRGDGGLAVRREADGGWTAVEEEAGELAAWLARAGARGVRVRPDRVVRSARR